MLENGEGSFSFLYRKQIGICKSSADLTYALENWMRKQKQSGRGAMNFPTIILFLNGNELDIWKSSAALTSHSENWMGK